MRFRLKSCLVLVVSVFGLLGLSASAQQFSANEFGLPAPPHAKQIHLKHVLIIGATKGYEHDSVSAAMNAIYTTAGKAGYGTPRCARTPNCSPRKILGIMRRP